MAQKNNPWVPIADLMSGCLLVFILMFVTMAVMPDLNAQSVRERLFANLNQALQADAHSQEVLHRLLVIDGARDVIRLKDAAFERGSACLSRNIKEALKRVIPEIKRLLDTYEGVQVYIEGHTDSVPVARTIYGCGYFQNNVQLSTLRAANTQAYLLSELGKQYAPRFPVAGYGDAMPINKEDPTARENRRVELRFVFSAGG